MSDAVEVRETGQGKYQTQATIGDKHFLIDEPAAVGGLGSGPTPYDLLASALGACTSITLRLYADRKGWPLKTVTVNVLHRRDGLEAKDRFAREITLDGELSSDQRARLLEIANRCPVHRTLERGSEVITIMTAHPVLDDPEPADHMSDVVEACAD